VRPSAPADPVPLRRDDRLDLPEPAHQVALDLAPDAASAFRMEPPAFQLHAWREGVGVVSHTAYIGDFAGPYPFKEESCPLPD